MKDKLLSLSGEFNWLWGQEFFIETEIGNFIWNDPDYNGDNTMRKYAGSCRDFMAEMNVDVVRYKGKHPISQYCGDQFVVMG